MSPADEIMRQTILRARLYRAMSRLTPLEEYMLRLAYTGMTYGDLSKAMDMSPWRVGNIIRKAFRRLCGKMEHDGVED